MTEVWNGGSAGAGACACFTRAVRLGADSSAEGNDGIAAERLTTWEKKVGR